MADNKSVIEALLQAYAKYLNVSDTSSIVPLYTRDGVLYDVPLLKAKSLNTKTTKGRS
jgi:ketosteroid isomerase-like protein